MSIALPQMLSFKLEVNLKLSLSSGGISCPNLKNVTFSWVSRPTWITQPRSLVQNTYSLYHLCLWDLTASQRTITFPACQQRSHFECTAFLFWKLFVSPKRSEMFFTYKNVNLFQKSYVIARRILQVTFFI